MKYLDSVKGRASISLLRDKVKQKSSSLTWRTMKAIKVYLLEKQLVPLHENQHVQCGSHSLKWSVSVILKSEHASESFGRLMKTKESRL